jgi:hypothetical protein
MALPRSIEHSDTSWLIYWRNFAPVGGALPHMERNGRKLAAIWKSQENLARTLCRSPFKRVRAASSINALGAERNSQECAGSNAPWHASIAVENLIAANSMSRRGSG